MGPGKVEVQSIDFPKLELGSRQCHHGVILKIVTTNICGSDQHMVRGRTTAPKGLVLGHEITGEIIEAGRDVEFLKVGDLVSVPFNIACGRCRNCKEGKDRNLPERQSGAARSGVWLCGYGRMGGRPGGICHGPLRGFQSAQAAGKRSGDGEDHRHHLAFGHLPHGIPRRGNGRRGPGFHRLCGGGRAGGTGLRCRPAICWAPPASSWAT